MKIHKYENKAKTSSATATKARQGRATAPAPAPCGMHINCMLQEQAERQEKTLHPSRCPHPFRASRTRKRCLARVHRSEHSMAETASAGGVVRDAKTMMRMSSACSSSSSSSSRCAQHERVVGGRVIYGTWHPPLTLTLPTTRAVLPLVLQCKMQP